MLKNQGLRVCIIDETEKRKHLAWSWRMGAVLFGFDVVLYVRGWRELEDKLTGLPYGSVVEVQFWGHAYPGDPLIGRSSMPNGFLERVRTTLDPDGALWWWRCCSTFQGHAGHAFARACAWALRCRVAGSTYLIREWHSGQHSVRPGQSPSWSTSEGLGPGGVALKSRPGEPNTILCVRSLPKGW